MAMRSTHKHWLSGIVGFVAGVFAEKAGLLSKFKVG